MLCSNTFIICIFIVLIGQLFLPIQASSPQVPLSTVSFKYTFSSCTNNELIPATLPNLSYAIETGAYTSNYTCNEGATFIGYRNVTWYYYEIYPPPGGDCGHTTEISPMQLYTTYRISGSNFVYTSTGTITSGKFMNRSVSRQILIPIASQNACNSAAGLEIQTGTITMTVTPGPTCAGIVVAEYCPGIHFNA